MMFAWSTRGVPGKEVMAGPVSTEEIFQLNLKDKSTFGSLRKRRGGPSILKESAYRCISSVAGGWGESI